MKWYGGPSPGLLAFIGGLLLLSVPSGAQTCAPVDFTSHTSSTDPVDVGHTYNLWWYAVNRGTSDISNAVAVVTFPPGTSCTDISSSLTPFPSPPVRKVLADGSTEMVITLAPIETARQAIKMVWQVEDTCVTGSPIIIKGKVKMVWYWLDNARGAHATMLTKFRHLHPIASGRIYQRFDGELLCPIDAHPQVQVR